MSVLGTVSGWFCELSTIITTSISIFIDEMLFKSFEALKYEFKHVEPLLDNIGQTSKDLKLHSLNSFRSIPYISHNIRTLLKVVFENRLANTLHIRQHSLPEVPTQQLVWRTRKTVKKILRNSAAGMGRSVQTETIDLMTILK